MRQFRRNKKPQVDYWTTDSGSDSSTAPNDDANNSHQMNIVMEGNGTSLSQETLGEGRTKGVERKKNSLIGAGSKRKPVSWRR